MDKTDSSIDRKIERWIVRWQMDKQIGRKINRQMDRQKENLEIDKTGKINTTDEIDKLEQSICLRHASPPSMQVAHCFALWHWSALSLAAVLMGSIPSLIISFFCHIFTDVAPVSEVPCLAPILWRRCHTCTSGTLAQMVSKG